MPPPKNWALTQLGEGASVVLTVDGVAYDVAQFTATYAANEIPNAQCLLAVGREVTGLRRAAVHATAGRLRQMRPATVVLRPRGEYDPAGTPWPAEVPLFRGYFMGLAFDKVNGKAGVVASLKHWLIDLAASSCLTQNSHPANPAHLTARAVMLALDGAGGASSHYLSQLPGVQLIRNDVVTDLWGAIKKLFCGLAGIPTMVGSSEIEGNCGGTGNPRRNERARRALARLEGPATIFRAPPPNDPGGPLVVDSDCSLDYAYGVPLPIQLLDVSAAQDAVAAAVTHASVDGAIHATFWDKIVGEYCPAFGLAVCPSVDFGLVVADTPAYRGGPWKEIAADEYDSFKMARDLDRPLRAVGVTVQYGSALGIAEASGAAAPAVPAVGGCFAANIEDPDDGIIQYVAAPTWLQVLVDHQPFARTTTGLAFNLPGRSDTTPAAAGGAAALPVPIPSASTMQAVNRLLNQFAQGVYVATALRGHAGVLGGKLRFDVAPGSVVRVAASPERFLAGEDALAAPVVGCVSRVTLAVNAESALGGTTFVLTHLRSDEENNEDRTSVAAHPLFGAAIHGGGKHGSPLVAGHERLGA